MSGVEAELRAIREEMARLNARLEVTGSALPPLLTKRAAAAALSVSLSKLKQLIRSHVVLTVMLDKRAMVPASEVQRLATPRSGQPPSVRQASRRKQVPQGLTGAAGAAALRASLRKRR